MPRKISSYGLLRTEIDRVAVQVFGAAKLVNSVESDAQTDTRVVPSRATKDVAALENVCSVAPVLHRRRHLTASSRIRERGYRGWERVKKGR